MSATETAIHEARRRSGGVPADAADGATSRTAATSAPRPLASSPSFA